MNEEIKNIKQNKEEIQLDSLLSEREIKSSNKILDNLIKEAINFEFKNIANIILLVANCVMPSTLVIFLEKRDIFNTLDFSKLILLIVSINIVILYGMVLARFISSDFEIIFRELIGNCRVLVIIFRNYKVEYMLQKIENNKIGSKRIGRYFEKVKKYQEQLKEYFSKTKEYNKKTETLNRKYTMNECFRYFLELNIIISFLLVGGKIIMYILEYNMPNKAFITIIFIAYVMLNINIIFKFIFGTIISIFSNIIDCVNNILTQYYNKIYKIEAKEDTTNSSETVQNIT